MPLKKFSIPFPNQEGANALADALLGCADPLPDAVTVFEDRAGWRVEAYYGGTGEGGDLARRLEAATGTWAGLPDPVPDLNWVALSQAALPPVRAGRFRVHGGHDRATVPRGPGAIEIDAGEAFGTAHHATTLGCLLAIDRLTRRRAFARVLDLGCGSGVLAIAAARALPGARILASDFDVEAVRVARANIRLNGMGSRIAVVKAAGLAHPRLRTARFDLVIANILAGPLIDLAPTLARAAVPGGTLVLSGLLIPQAPAVVAAYRSAGFALIGHQRLAGWSTVVMGRRTIRALSG